MSSLSIRKLPRDVEQALCRAAKAQKTTKTEIVLQALQERFQLGDRERKRRNLRGFFGRMTMDQYTDFKKTTEPFSEIERDLWKS